MVPGEVENQGCDDVNVSNLERIDVVSGEDDASATRQARLRRNTS